MPESLVPSCSVQKPATCPMPQLAPVFEAILPCPSLIKDQFIVCSIGVLLSTR